MKKVILFGSALAFTLVGMSFESIERVEAVYNQTAAPAKNTGSPGDGSICTACHFGSPVVSKSDIITTDIPAEGYVPGNTYTITVTLTNQGTSRFGFQLSPQNQAGAMLGTWGPATTETQVISSKYATHKMAGTSGTNTKTWNLQWTAPSAGTGDVTFYGAFNIANGDNNTTGDIIWKSSHTVSEQGANSLSAGNKLTLKAFVDGNGQLHVNLDQSTAGAVEIRLVDMNGKEASKWVAENNEAMNWSAKLPELSAGVYTVQVKAGAKEGAQKIVIY